MNRREEVLEMKIHKMNKMAIELYLRLRARLDKEDSNNKTDRKILDKWREDWGNLK